MKAIASSDCYLSKVGSQPNPKGVSFIFCNGAGSSREAAEKNASLISKSLDNQVVSLFYNPTGINSDGDKRTNPPDVNNLSNLFLAAIKNEIEGHLQNGCERVAIKIKLFLHSHGALIAKNAISQLSPADRSNLEIYTFGSIKMFSKSDAQKAINFVHENDLIAEGSSLIDASPILYDFKQIDVQVKAGMNRFLAIFKQAELDLRRHLSPYREGYGAESDEVRSGKDKRYAEIFLNPTSDGKALSQDPYFQDRCKYYCSVLEDYEIILLPGVARNSIEAESFEEFCKRSLKDVAVNAFTNHLFPTYVTSVFSSPLKSKL